MLCKCELSAARHRVEAANRARATCAAATKLSKQNKFHRVQVGLGRRRCPQVPLPASGVAGDLFQSSTPVRGGGGGGRRSAPAAAASKVLEGIRRLVELRQDEAGGLPRSGR